MQEKDPIRQALKDFVATSNSGKYNDENVLLSKFPELQNFDKQALRDFVATSNSGKYQSEDEIFSKFPEFTEVKKKNLWHLASRVLRRLHALVVCQNQKLFPNHL